MTGSNIDSSTTNEVLNGGAHLKRENDFDGDDLVPKKSRISTLNAENVEKVGENLDNHIHESTPILTETNCQNGTNIELDVSKDNQICEDSISLEDEISIEADAAEDKGSRHTMEDAWVVLPDASMEFPGKLRCAHFAIYDGHGGRLAADYARNHLHANVLSAGLPRFRKTDELLLQESTAGGWQDGATAVCVWILGQTVYAMGCFVRCGTVQSSKWTYFSPLLVLVANVGDAKAVLARSSTVNGDGTNCQLKSIVITREHKAIYPQERARIQKAGGSVGSNGRLQGRLEVSRAFGDRQFKKVGVIATPDIHSFDLTEREQFIILGCDGLWGVFGPSDAIEFVDKQLKDGSSATAVSRRLVREAVRERRCKDNCTAIVIVFRRT
ncbi:probable protein phosphatase 2C 8 isoform X2 [Magnolia sinica]|uniref:probable protein phosphatase 2C 8 isoform X2 n=1 Tax=Magnolia sinica TaxID=86752 RepID=UPI002658E7CF|nr:probable protein phosphatase 2C 8 isoform X2 [Magnolia sinica]